MQGGGGLTTVIVAGAVASKRRHGGSVWVRMSWAQALRQLGFEVIFIEELAAVHPDGSETLADEIETSAAAMRIFGFTGAAALVGSDGAHLHGISREELLDRARGAELLVNISGNLRRPELLALPRRRVFVDLDPGYTQVWLTEGRPVGACGHDLYFTVGANVGTRRSTVPLGGLRWRSVRQPVVLERWPLAAGGFTRFTTVGSWRGAFGPVGWQGRTYGVKAHEFRSLAEVPRRTGLPFEVVLDIHDADAGDAERLRAGGWRTLPPAVTADTTAFARYVQGSGAECSAAQSVYVETRSGWFSDRSTRYLACGRPALVQDTGQGDTLPVGEGLITFTTPAEAAAGARRIVEDYERHRRAARRIAEECFAPAPALSPLLEAAEVAP
jgi:hypothetical protein